MKYEPAEDLQERMKEIVELLNLDHVDVERVKCFRSYGSSTKRTLARCHTIGKLMQKTIGVKAHYAIEFLEKFEKLSKKDQDKVIIHELMHIPKTFGGGFRQHDFVCEENVELMYEKFLNLKGAEVKIKSTENNFEIAKKIIGSDNTLDKYQNKNIENYEKTKIPIKKNWWNF